MQRRFKINVEGRDYVVAVEEITEDGGDLYPNRGTMRAEPTVPSQSASVPAAPEAGAGTLQPAAGPGEVVSPMACIVLAIHVEVGASVEADTRVLTLDAMKTKTMVTAGRAGTVSAISVSAGQGVEAGHSLFTIA